MPDPQTAPFGSWPSPITSDMIVASSIGLGEILIDGGGRLLARIRARRKAADR